METDKGWEKLRGNNEEILVYDIESQIFGKPDITKDRLKIFGCYSYKLNKTLLLTNKDEIQKVIDSHKILVGFNNAGTYIQPGYDNPILEREGINLKYKTIIDLRNVIVDRAAIIKIDKGLLKDLLLENSLDFITRTLGIVDENEAKIKIDYSMFMKDVWSAEEMKEISTYTKRDIEVTRKLYEWCENFFEPFKHYLRQEDIDKKVYISASTAKLAYKATCKEIGWEEQYEKNYEAVEGEEHISGGYVSYPAGEMFEDCVCLDFASLYPFIMIQCNLHGRRKIGDDRPFWNGNFVWKTEGSYYSDKLNPIGEMFKKWYAERVVFKKAKDKREYALKILLNSSYGITLVPYYKKVYDKIAGGDCTRIGRQWIKYARKRYSDFGIQNIYTDTDSVYLKGDKEKIKEVTALIIKEIKDTVPFPQDNFNLKHEFDIKYLYFFKGKDEEHIDDEMDNEDFVNKGLNLMKKNYLAITDKDEVIIKNLGIQKKSNTPLSKKIFWEYLVPEIKKGKIKFDKTFIRNTIQELLSKDLSLIVLRKEVGPKEQYVKSAGSLPAQIAEKYGQGIHFLVPNTVGVGVGKDKKYCTIEEFKSKGLSINHINLENVWKELDYFIKEQKVKSLFDFVEEE
jgi:DNA polymerase elongation subunit (family B)